MRVIIAIRLSRGAAFKIVKNEMKSQNAATLQTTMISNNFTIILFDAF